MLLTINEISLERLINLYNIDKSLKNVIIDKESIIKLIENDSYKKYLFLYSINLHQEIEYDILCDIYIENENSKILNDLNLFNIKNILKMLNYGNVNDKFTRCILYDNIKCIEYYARSLISPSNISISTNILKELLLYHPNSKVFKYLSEKGIILSTFQDVYDKFDKGDVQRAILYNNIEQVKYLVENKNKYVYELLKEWNFCYKISLANTDVYKYLCKECKDYMIE